MADDPEWDALFDPNREHSDGDAEPARSEPSPRRRALRSSRPRRNLVAVWVLLGLLAVGAAGVAAVWTLFEPQVRSVLGWQVSNDYEGDGNGEPVTIVIAEGEIGEDVARTLHDAGVTKTFDAFYELLLVQNPVFAPGAYRLEQQMSAASALDALSDPENRVSSRALVREGITLQQTYAALSEATGVAVAEYEAAGADPASFGLPASAPSLEGYLFPATYDFDPGVTAQQQLERLATTMLQRLDALGVPETDRHRVVTTASLIQREAGRADDFPRVARVILNRLDAGMPLQFDSTSHYGYAWRTGASSAGDSVFTTDAERADDNPYNTYVHPGLPIGPISAPGDTALEAALAPVAGDWLFFVTVNLDSGETVFTSTLAEHDRAVAQLRTWCRENPDSGC